jgi:hypothetical protein
MKLCIKNGLEKSARHTVANVDKAGLFGSLTEANVLELFRWRFLFWQITTPLVVIHKGRKQRGAVLALLESEDHRVEASLQLRRLHLAVSHQKHQTLAALNYTYLLLGGFLKQIGVD